MWGIFGDHKSFGRVDSLHLNEAVGGMTNATRKDLVLQHSIHYRTLAIRCPEHSHAIRKFDKNLDIVNNGSYNGQQSRYLDNRNQGCLYNDTIMLILISAILLECVSITNTLRKNIDPVSA